MNTYDISLEIVIVGVRGGGKTLLATHYGCEGMQRFWVIRKLIDLNGEQAFKYKKRHLWSNYKIEALWKPDFANKAIHLESEELDIDKLVVWDKIFQDGIIIFDEIDQVADRQDWFSTVSKFLTAGLQVIRHRNITIILTIQSLEWLNARLQWQADIIIKCRDLAFTPWGKENNVQLGEVINTTWIDKSGIMTGSSFEENNKLYNRKYLGKRYHGAYARIRNIDIIEQKSRRKIITPELIIDKTGKIENEITSRDILNNTVMYFIYNNMEEVSKYDFWDKAREFGFVDEQRNYASYLREKGIRETGQGNYSKYKMANVKIEVAGT